MKPVVVLWKKEGETPLECLERFRRRNREYRDVPMTYAGRLDPLVSGVLLVLAGDIRKQKEKYLGLSKEYEFEVLFGFATDTYDILGKVQHSNILENVGMLDLEQEIKKNLKFFRGKFIQKYPMYSSRTVAGKPLFAYAREGKPVESPEREVFVRSLKLLKVGRVSEAALLKNIERRIAKVGGDFRQKEILKIWRRELGRKKSARGLFAASFRIKCGSGTYVRSIANSLGERMGIPALALTIKRTKVGRFEV